MAEKLEIIIGAQDQFSSTFGKLKGAIAGVAAAYLSFQSVKTVAAMFKEVADEADKFSKLSDRLGFTTETLSKMAYAAKLADVEFSSMAQSMQFMLKNTSEAAKGNENLQESIARLGLNLSRLQQMSPDDMFRAYAEGLASIQNPAERANLAMELFGRGGGVMLQMLKDGAEGLDALGKEAEKFGVVISAQAAYNAAEFNDSLTRMGEAFQGVKNALILDLLPGFTGAFNKIANLIAENRQDVVEWAGTVATVFGKVAEVSAYVVAGISDAWNGLKLIWNSLLYSVADLALGMKNIWIGVITYIKDGMVTLNEAWNENPVLPGTDVFEGAIVGMQKFIGEAKLGQAELLRYQTDILAKMDEIASGGLSVDKVQKYIAEIKAAMAELQNAGTAKLKSGGGGSAIAGGLSSSMKSELESLKNMWSSYYDSATGQADRWREMEIAKVKGNKEALLLIEQIYQAKLLEIAGKRLEAEESARNGLVLAYDQQRLKGEAQRISEMDKLNIWYGEQLEQYGAYEDLKAQIEHTYAENSIEAKKKDAQTEVEINNERLDAYGQLLGGMAALSASMGKKAFMLSKALNLGQAIMSTYAGAAAALKDYAYPYNIIAAAAVIAFGMAQVAKIASQKPPQAKKGVDYVPADQTYQLHKGERVVPAETNKDLRAFLSGGQGGGMQIGSISLSFPNLNSTADLKAMSNREWQDIIEQKMIPNMRRLAGAGIKV